MPLREILWRNRLAAMLLVSEVNNQRVTPLPGGRVDAVLTAAQLADGRPGARGKDGRVKLSDTGHVGAQARPGGLVIWVHSQSRPDVGGKVLCLLLSEGIGDSESKISFGLERG